MPASGDLYDAAIILLNAANDGLENSIEGRIDRAFVSQSAPVFDCAPQLTVHAGDGKIFDSFYKPKK